MAVKIERSIYPRQSLTTPEQSKINTSQTKPVSTTNDVIVPNNISKEELINKVESVNKFLDSAHTNVKFNFHEQLNEYYITIVNSDTMEVVKEIPPRKFLDMYASMLESIGLIVDHKI